MALLERYGLSFGEQDAMDEIEYAMLVGLTEGQTRGAAEKAKRAPQTRTPVTARRAS